jgi:hypothetical protein
MLKKYIEGYAFNLYQLIDLSLFLNQLSFIQHIIRLEVEIPNNQKGKLLSPPLSFVEMTLTPPLVLKLTPTSLKFSSNIQTSPFYINTVNFPLILSFQYQFHEPPGDRQTENYTVAFMASSFPSINTDADTF